MKGESITHSKVLECVQKTHILRRKLYLRCIVHTNKNINVLKAPIVLGRK